MLNKLFCLIKDYGLLDVVRTTFSLPHKLGDQKFAYIPCRMNMLGDPWICYLPWKMELNEAERFGLIPKRSPSYVCVGPVGIPHWDPAISRELQSAQYSALKNLNLQRFNILSYSVGTYPAFFMANRFNVDRLICVVPGSRLGAAIWEGYGTRRVRRASELFGIKTATAYDYELYGSNPTENLWNLPKTVDVHLSTHDYYIRTRLGEELVTMLLKVKPDTGIFRYEGRGHIQTILSFAQNSSL